MNLAHHSRDVIIAVLPHRGRGRGTAAHHLPLGALQGVFRTSARGHQQERQVSGAQFTCASGHLACIHSQCDADLGAPNGRRPLLAPSPELYAATYLSAPDASLRAHGVFISAFTDFLIFAFHYLQIPLFLDLFISAFADFCIYPFLHIFISALAPHATGANALLCPTLLFYISAFLYLQICRLLYFLIPAFPAFCIS